MNGIVGMILRENLVVLVGVGLINCNDSFNGKCYVRCGKDGEVEIVYGFSFVLLFVRVEEFVFMV